MPYNLTKGKVVVCVTSRALFDLEAEHEIFVNEGLQAFLKYQEKARKQKLPVRKGPAYELVRKLLNLSSRQQEVAELSHPLSDSSSKEALSIKTHTSLAYALSPITKVEVIIVSKNHPHITHRLHDALEEWGMNGINRMSFTGGGSLLPYLEAWKCDLFLSASEESVREVHHSKLCAAAVILPLGPQSPLGTPRSHASQSQEEEEGKQGKQGDGAAEITPRKPDPPDSQLENKSTKRGSTKSMARSAGELSPLCVALDGDAVVFDSSSQAIYDKHGLEVFLRHEETERYRVLGPGPFWSFFGKLLSLRDNYPAAIRVALVTARQAPAHHRVLETLANAGLFLDEAHFLGGVDKTEFLTAFGADIFFDDGESHVERARNAKIPSGLVPVASPTTTNSLLTRDD